MISMDMWHTGERGKLADGFMEDERTNEAVTYLHIGPLHRQEQLLHEDDVDAHGPIHLAVVEHGDLRLGQG